MPRKYLAFDIEIVKPIPVGTQDWKSFRPLGISCAATFDGEGEPILWHGRTDTGEIAPHMNREDSARLVNFLAASAHDGLTVLTWNGLGFDFDILAEESGESEACRLLALNHVDMMFHLFCCLGYALSLDRAAHGMGLPGKTPGMTSDMAPVYWAQGRYWEVMKYVAQDVRTTLNLALEADQRGMIQWSSKQGVLQKLPLPQGWLTAAQAMALPEPDTSWMRQPWRRSRFTSWFNA
jgi:hypothetical protein